METLKPGVYHRIPRPPMPGKIPSPTERCRAGFPASPRLGGVKRSFLENYTNQPMASPSLCWPNRCPKDPVRLGPYDIVSRLGAGAMGESTAPAIPLGRDVAIKILPADVSSDPGRRARFEQEARAVAALNHPEHSRPLRIGNEEGVLLHRHRIRGRRNPLRAARTRPACRPARCSTSPCRSPTEWPPPTPPASPIATSSPSTS